MSDAPAVTVQCAFHKQELAISEAVEFVARGNKNKSTPFYACLVCTRIVLAGAMESRRALDNIERRFTPRS